MDTCVLKDFTVLLVATSLNSVQLARTQRIWDQLDHKTAYLVKSTFTMTCLDSKAAKHVVQLHTQKVEQQLVNASAQTEISLNLLVHVFVVLAINPRTMRLTSTVFKIVSKL